MEMEHCPSALLQLHLHSRHITSSFNGLGKHNCETRSILVFGVSASYIRSFTVDTIPRIKEIYLFWYRRNNNRYITKSSTLQFVTTLSDLLDIICNRKWQLRLIVELIKVYPVYSHLSRKENIDKHYSIIFAGKHIYLESRCRKHCMNMLNITESELS